MSKKKEQQPQAVTGQAVEGDPLACKIGPQHVIAELQKRYPTVFDACMGFAQYAAQEAQARLVVAERDKEIEELRAQIAGKCAVKGAEQILADGKAE